MYVDLIWETSYLLQINEVTMNGIHPAMNGVRVALQPNGHVRTVAIHRNDDPDKPQVQ